METSITTFILALAVSTSTLACVSPESFDNSFDEEAEAVAEDQEAIIFVPPIPRLSASLGSSDGIVEISPPASDPSYYPEDFVLEVTGFTDQIRTAIADYGDATLATPTACQSARWTVVVYCQQGQDWALGQEQTMRGVWVVPPQGNAFCNLHGSFSLPSNASAVRIAGTATYQDPQLGAVGKHIALGASQSSEM